MAKITLKGEKLIANASKLNSKKAREGLWLGGDHLGARAKLELRPGGDHFGGGEGLESTRPAPIEWSGGDVSLGMGAVPA